MTKELSQDVAERVQRATVKLPGKGGQGVIVGDYIITAAHCIDWSRLTLDKINKTLDTIWITIVAVPAALFIIWLVLTLTLALAAKGG